MPMTVLVTGGTGFIGSHLIQLLLKHKYNVILLNDSGITIEDIKIWGSQVQPTFCNWAFNRSIDRYDHHPDIRPHWDMIPDDTDILITHGPPQNVLDYVYSCRFGVSHGENVGCPFLKETVDKIKPKLHIFGHIHNEQGFDYNNDTTFINASQLDDNYQVAYTPKTVIWKDGAPHTGIKLGEEDVDEEDISELEWVELEEIGFDGDIIQTED